MKLRNKKTGEIVEFRYLQSDYVAPLVLTTYENDKPEMFTYNSLAELNSEWEDAPEDAIQVYIEGIQNVYMGGGRVYIDYASAQEAEKAVRKLKAWKRLKDKGFRFTGYTSKDRGTITEFEIYCDTGKPCIDRDEFTDLDICFGGEE